MNAKSDISERCAVPVSVAGGPIGRGVRPTSGSLDVVVCGREEYPAGYAEKRVRVPHYGLELVAAGAGRLALGHRSHPLKPGDVFTCGPKTPHVLVADAHRPMVKYFVHFCGHRAALLLDEAGLVPGTCITLADMGPAVDLFDDLVAAVKSEQDAAARVRALLLELLVLRCAEARRTDSVNRSRAFETFQTCRALASRDLAQIRDPSDLARAAGLDVAYLCRLFRRFSGQTTSRFLMQVRLREAARRLRESNCLVKQVAADLGFSDPFHFSRAFKREYKVPPDQFMRE